MGVLTATPGNHANTGQYSVLPTSPVATTTSGSGTGATFTPLAYTASHFTYGTDDTAAWTAAFNQSQAMNNAGNFNCIIMSGGIFVSHRATTDVDDGPVHSRSEH